MLKWRILDFLSNTVYRAPEPPPRTREKPMEVICVGLPRSGTESLQVALLKLGYDYTYHGWDILFEDPHYMEAWSRLVKKKWYGPPDGESNITRADFDAIIGHAVAITDAPGAIFAAELVAAYPEAKVILNMRRDSDAWHRSAVKNMVEAVNDRWSVYILSWLTSRAFWAWMTSQRLMNRMVFRAHDEGERALGRAIRNNGKWVYREHAWMIRGMVPKENLLEWDVGDGWEPLCKFLGKEIPKEPFPKTNNPAGFEARVQKFFADNQAIAIRNLCILSAGFVGIAALSVWKLAPERALGLWNSMQKSWR